MNYWPSVTRDRPCLRNVIRDSGGNVRENQSKNQSMKKMREEMKIEPLREVEINDVDVNFLSKTIRTRSGRAITLSKERCLPTQDGKTSLVK